jgi:hypothetical protein
LTFVAVKDGLAVHHADVGYNATGNLSLKSNAPIAEIIRPADPIFQAQTALVINWAELRAERATEILAQIPPQFAFFGSIINLQPHRHRHTIELLVTALQLAVFAEMRFKHALACRRPVDYSAQVQPMIVTPGHGSFPSGHSTQAYIAAEVLRQLTGPTSQQVDQLQRQAQRIAQNRTVAGVHFPADSIAGRLLGTTLGEYFVSRCTGNTSWQARKCDGAKIKGTQEFEPQSQKLAGNGAFYALIGAPSTSTMSPLLNWLWAAAEKEWA